MPHHPTYTFITRRIQALALISLIGATLGALGNYHWIAELFSHFWAWYGAFFTLAILFARSHRQRLAWLIPTLFSAYWLFTPLPITINISAQQTHRTLWYNVNLDNPNPAAEITLIQQHSPNLIALAEINLDDTRWQPLQQAYPHGCQHQESSPFALALWSKTPLQSCHISYINDLPLIRAQLPNGTAIYALHPPPPINAELAQTRLNYLHQAAAQIAREHSVLVLGDLNTTPFSPVFRDFTASAQLQNAMTNITPTWFLFGLHIDHVLHRHAGNVQTTALPWGESDHRAILVTRQF